MHDEVLSSFSIGGEYTRAVVRKLFYLLIVWDRRPFPWGSVNKFCVMATLIFIYFFR
jgi:hypothetical protein